MGVYKVFLYIFVCKISQGLEFWTLYNLSRNNEEIFSLAVKYYKLLRLIFSILLDFPSSCVIMTRERINRKYKSNLMLTECFSKRTFFLFSRTKISSYLLRVWTILFIRRLFLVFLWHHKRVSSRED